MLLISANFLATASLMPHGNCYLWKPGLVGLHMVSDAVIALSYFSIPITLLYILRQRADVPFNGIFWLFAAFIIFCGTGHLIDIWTLWHPDYWISGYVRAMTAVVSFITAIVLTYLVPQILTLPTPEKLQAEIEEKKQKEQFLRSIYEGVTEAIFVVDTTKEGEFIYESINPVTEKLMGMTSKQVEGKTMEQVLPHNLALLIRERYNQCLSTGRSITYEECLRFDDDSEYSWWLTNLKPIYNQNSQIYRIVGTSVDITERKQAEARLRESERRFRAIFDSMYQFIGLLKPDGTLLEANQTALDFGGITKEDVVNCPFWENYWWTISPETQQQLQQAIKRAANGEFVRYEVDVLGAGNKVTTIDFSLKPVFNDLGKVELLIPEGRDITEKKQIIEALQKSEERWNLALLGTGDGIFDWDLSTNEAFFSTQYKEMLGYADSEVENSYQGWRDLVHPEDIDLAEATWKAYINHEIPQYRAEFRLRCQDGSYKWILARGMAQWNQDGEAIRMVGFHQDISERKAAQAEIVRLNQQLEARVKRRTAQLEESNKYKDELIESQEIAKAEIQIYEDIVENIQIGLCIWQMDDINDITSFRLATINPVASQMLGVNIEDDIDKPIKECFPNLFDDEHIAIVEAYAEVVKSKQVKDFGEFAYGDDRVPNSWFEVTAFPLPDNLVGVAFNNVGERKRMETALAENERLYRNVVNSVKEVVFQIAKTGIWTFLSAAWADITGFAVEDNLLKTFTDFMYAEEDKLNSRELFESVISGKQEHFQYEFRILTKDENFRWLEIYAQIEHNSNGETLGVYGTLNDVTERKQVEAVLQARADELAQINLILLQTTGELEKRNQELDQFAYVTSHDLKAPLRAIANLSEWIEEDLQEALTPDTQKQMNLLRGRVYRMEALINGLLQYSRVGRMKTEPEKVAVAQLLEEIIDSIAPPQEFTIEIIGEMPTFRTAKIPLQQIFTNLIGNAVKHHNRSDGRIAISVLEQDKFYEFAIADDGKGIAEKYHDKIFVIFQTLESRDKRENTGIGLAIVKRIIEEFGGKITLDSQLGKGTTFRFTWLKKRM
ncbi:PAS domain S-box [Rivularia sp. PCC 7116]|uniref:PAS domain-containing sensor histidine kinase n=1 Tax=Rivularia sp. PCC 7116 TaxID=373994 RepID=UPI00029F4963|nr:PAS domain S-box protein [Rivularia sp. PCC 7116]AFY55245.1 PAS domain S-box [Rivularia sp. PCC 7116]